MGSEMCIRDRCVCVCMYTYNVYCVHACTYMWYYMYTGMKITCTCIPTWDGGKGIWPHLQDMHTSSPSNHLQVWPLIALPCQGVLGQQVSYSHHVHCCDNFMCEKQESPYLVVVTPKHGSVGTIDGHVYTEVTVHTLITVFCVIAIV